MDGVQPVEQYLKGKVNLSSGKTYWKETGKTDTSNLDVTSAA
jgi:hypothetical protein